MPKEVTHWIIADDVLAQNKAYIKTEYRNVVFLGAVFHDVFYYYTKCSNKKIADLPDKFHGSNKEDSFYFVGEMMNLYKQADKQDKELVKAFLVGFISHIFVDINFHPYVYYITGNYYDEDPEKLKMAVQKHREIECLIDLFFEEDASNHKVFDIGSIFNDGSQYLELIFSNGIEFKEYGVFLTLDDIMHSYKNFSIARKIFTNFFCVKILSFAEPLLPKSFQAIKQLSYHNTKYYRQKDLTGELSYFDTVTNKLQVSTLQCMKENAVKDTLDFCRLFPEFLDGTTDLPIGPSLETGHINSSVYDMKYFYTGM